MHGQQNIKNSDGGLRTCPYSLRMNTPRLKNGKYELRLQNSAVEY